MTRIEYMDRLLKALESFSPELREEIMEDYRQHFAEGGRQGKSDEELIKELGRIEDMIQDLRGGYEDHAASLPEKSLCMEADNTDGRVQKESGAVAHVCRSVVLKCKSADIIAGRSGDGKIHVSYKSSTADRMRYDFYQYEKDGVFYAGQREKNSFSLGFGGFRTVLDIKLPEGLETLTVSVSSGDVSLSGITAADGHFTSMSGDITICHTKLSLAVLSSRSGDLMLKDSAMASGKFSSSSGDITIDTSMLDTALLSSRSGDIEIDNTALATGKYSVSSGDINIKGGSVGNLTCEACSGDIHMDITAIETGMFSGSSGDITVKMNDAPQSIALHTVSGDIRLILKEAEGIEASIKCRAGDASVKYKGQKKTGIKNETFTYGDGSCRITAEAVSGDIFVCCK